MKKPFNKFTLLVLSLAFVHISCTFKFEVTSQRTALENQVLGSYKQLDDELVLTSAVRSSAAATNSQIKPSVLKARRSQQFNLDDVDELKDEQIIGESNSGQIKILGKNIGHSANAKPHTLKLAGILVKEENRDRSIIWQHIVDDNKNLNQSDLSGVIKTFVKTQREGAKIGHWIQEDNGHWIRKAPKAVKKDHEESE